MQSKKRKSITLATKVKILESSKTMNTVDICQKYEISPSSLSRIKSNSKSILESSEKMDNNVKRIRSEGNLEEITNFILYLINKCNEVHIPICDSLIREWALTKAKELKFVDFKASNGWLNGLKKRNSINLKTISGESASSDYYSAIKYQQNFKSKIIEYGEENIYNLDETCLFWRQLPSKTITSKQKISGIKASKNRVTILFASSMSGEKLTPLIIGHYKRPRPLLGLDLDYLGLKYTSSKNGWMNSSIFEEYCNLINDQMKSKNKNILMLMDNFSAHVNLKLSNITFEYIPKNTTALIQPLDQGIISNFKTYYRKNFLNSIVTILPSGIEFKYDSYNLKNALENISASWQSVKNTTISNCFNVLRSQETPENEDIIYEVNKISRLSSILKDNNYVSELDTPEDFINCESRALFLNPHMYEDILQEVPENQDYINIQKKADIKEIKKCVSKMKKIIYRSVPLLINDTVMFENKILDFLNNN